MEFLVSFKHGCAESTVDSSIRASRLAAALTDCIYCGFFLRPETVMAHPETM